MSKDEILILTGNEIHQVLSGKEDSVMDAIREGYRLHKDGKTVLPYSSFLRPPDGGINRIISLPGWLGGDSPIAGNKWIASFPDNLGKNMERASATIITNSVETGRPKAILEGSIVSANRTAASAAIAAQCLVDDLDIEDAGVIGCGYINFETVRYLRVVFLNLKRFVVYDINSERAASFRKKLLNYHVHCEVSISDNLEEIFRTVDLVTIATTASTPHFPKELKFRPGAVALHISLRDFSPEQILVSDNVVDDISHVCREQTSIHLAEQLVGRRDFIRCTIAELIEKKAPDKSNRSALTIFSPFGLCVLDLSLSRLVIQSARVNGLGTVIDGFIPDPWLRRE